MSVDGDLATLREWITDTSYAKPGTLEHAALARVEAELSRLREQRDFNIRQGDYLNDQRRAAEARCARLQQALDTLMAEAQHHNLWWLENRIREALAAPDTPAGSQECEHEWVDARNEAVISGEMCPKCGAMRAAVSQPEEPTT